MRRPYYLLSLFCILLILTALTPHAASAEGEPTPEPVLPPWITGQNTEVKTGSEPASAVEPSGVVVDSPGLVNLAPQQDAFLAGELVQLAVPQRTQDPDDPTCGAAALGMALEFLSLTGGGEAPSTETLIKDLDASGFLYQTGTGVEELAALARSYGYRGASPFHGWSLEKLAGELASGHPVVVSLGLNGENQPGHFVTLTGMAADGSWVAYNDPVLGEQTLSAEEFLAAWGSQGCSGLAVRKGALAAASDPLLPWLGLLGAVSTLAVLARSYPLGSEFKNLLAGIQSLLADPRRKGLGGRLATMAGGGGNSSSPPHSAPAGYHWEKKVSPKYGWKDHLVTKTRQVPILIEKKVKVGTKVWYENVARYRDVRVDRGRYAWRKVTNYKREKYVRYYRTTRVKKTHWVRRGYRFVPQTYYVTKRTPVYGYRNVPNGIRWERYWKSNWVTEKQFDGYTRVRHEQDIYETRRVPTGRYRTEYYTDNVPVYEQVGTTVNWELKRDPTPTPAPPYTTTPVVSPTQDSHRSDNQVQTDITTGTPWPTGTPIATVKPTETPQSTATPTSQYEWLYTGTGTPEPNLIENNNDFDPENVEGKWIAKGIRLIKTAGKVLTARSVMFNSLESGLTSVSAPSLQMGTRREFLQGFGFNGTTYKPSTLTNITGKQLVSGALSKGTWITAGVTSLIGNVIDYGFGKNKDKGFGQEFAVSTAVDTFMAVGTGVLAAGAVALGTALFSVTLPVWGAIAFTALAGLAIGGMSDAFGVGNFLKTNVNKGVDAVEVGVRNLSDDVADGIEAWKGVSDNAKIIGNYIGEEINDTAFNVASSISNTVNNTIETIEKTGDTVGTVIDDTVDKMGDVVEETVSNAVNAVGNFLGSVFGGGG